ncbi:recombinase family protein [Streptomyces sp. NPDC057575]|uniref:recombinase family protein n=1 Tax=unclassified Streptomyces TaxID=2593676 RepID=UPI003691C8D3
MSDDYKRVESHDCPMSTCTAPAGSPCRTGKGKVAIQYHTARFRLVPQLAKALDVPTPAVRKPGSVWAELPRPVNAGTEPVGHVRLGYARASTARQSLDAQLGSLAEAGVPRVFSEEISTRARTRPEQEAAVKLAGEIRSSGVAVTLVVHEHKWLGRGIELAMLAEELEASDVGLEFLTGELKGSHAPSGIVFTVLAAMSGMEREYIRDRTLEGHESVPVADAAMVTAGAAALRRVAMGSVLAFGGRARRVRAAGPAHAGGVRCARGGRLSLDGRDEERGGDGECGEDAATVRCRASADRPGRRRGGAYRQLDSHLAPAHLHGPCAVPKASLLFRLLSWRRLWSIWLPTRWRCAICGGAMEPR